MIKKWIFVFGMLRESAGFSKSAGLAAVRRRRPRSTHARGSDARWNTTQMGKQSTRTMLTAFVANPSAYSFNYKRRPR